MPAMERKTTRRNLLRLLAGASLLAADGRSGFAAGPASIGRLIAEAKAFATVSQRIDFISSKLIGVPYKAHTLIGSANRSEVLVVRDDAFDCVTYCEVVLAAAVVRDMAGFESALRKIRYDQGQVDWHKRNHYFADWCRRNVDNKVCRPIVIGEPVKIDKVVSSEPAVGKRSWTLDAIRKAALLSNRRQLKPGDIVGFVSRRSNLDYFHTGFVAFRGDGALLLRHASRMHRRVVQERMDDFFAVNRNEFVTVLRPEETPASQDMSKAPG